MEVKPSEQVIPNEFDFSNIDVLSNELDENKDGSYSKRFWEFISWKTIELREAFVETVPDQNHAEYLRVFDASSSLVRNTLELVWHRTFSYSDPEIKLKMLEKRKDIVGRNLEFFKSELDKLPWWKRTARHLNPRSGLMFSFRNTISLLSSLLSDVEQVQKLIRRCSNDDRKNITLFKHLSEQVRLNPNPDIAAQLRKSLFLLQLKSFEEGYNDLNTFLESVVDVLRFIVKWRLWVYEEIRWNQECSKGNHWNATAPQSWPKAPVIW